MDPLRAIAEPTRRRILGLVWDRELSATEIAERFDSTFGAVSQHLGVLRDANLVSLRQEGTRRFYRANREALEAMWRETLRGLAQTIEEDGR
jgi:DNA-binding transcriptional ArsR family regulator